MNLITKRYMLECVQWRKQGRGALCYPARQKVYRGLKERHPMERIVRHSRWIARILDYVEANIKDG